MEYPNDGHSLQARWLERVGIGAAVFTAVITLLMLGNFFALRRSDPIHAPALLQLAEQLKAEPQNEPLKEQIRDLDYLARSAFFSSQRFQRLCTFLVIVSSLATIVAFKSLAASRKRLPCPSPNPPKEDLKGSALWARRAVSGAGLLLVGLALSLSLPFRSPLDTAVQTQPSQVSVKQPASQEFAKNWPSFLGVASGRVLQSGLPTKWDGSTGDGIVWKAELPKPGLSSPVIWNDRIFLTGADANVREVYCLDREKGALLWKHEAGGIEGSPATAPNIVEDTTYAAPTMATDGSSVFAMFGTGDLVALDFSGKRLWARNLGVPPNMYGHSSSLVVADGMVLVQLDGDKGGALYGIETKSGNNRWKAERALHASWASPIVVETSGRRQVVTAATPALIGYALDSGAELWRIDCFDKRAEVAPTPVFANGLIYTAAESGGLMALDPVKRGTVWKIEDSVPGVCTPIVNGELLFYGLNDGGIHCRDAHTGAAVWEAESEGGIYASPLLAGNRVYLIDRTGVTYIFAATNRFELIARPALGEEVTATPAAHGNNLYIRGQKHLFRIGS